MKHLIAVFIILLIFVSEIYAQLSPIVSLSMDMHSSTVNEVDIDILNNRFISVSNDKTLRLWSYPEIKLLGVARTPLDYGEDGQLTRCVLRPSSNYAVISGKTGTKRTNSWINSNGLYSFYLVDLNTMKIIDKVGAFDKEIMSMRFSPNGNLLVVTSQYEQLALYQSDNMAFMGGITFDDERMRGAYFLNDTVMQIITDCRIYLYGLEYLTDGYVNFFQIAKLKVNGDDEISYNLEKNELYISGEKWYLFYCKKYYKKIGLHNLKVLERKKIKHLEYREHNVSNKDTIYRENWKIPINKIIYRNNINSYNSAFKISSQGDSIFIALKKEPTYCLSIKNLLLTLHTDSIQRQPTSYSFGGYYEQLRIFQGYGIYTRDGYIYTHGGYVKRTNYDRDAFYDNPLPSLPVSVKCWVNQNYFMILLEDGSLRWYRARDGKEVLSLYITKNGKWVMWTPQGYYYTPEISDSHLIEWRQQNYMQVLVRKPIDYRSMFYNFEEISKVINSLFVNAEKENTEVENESYLKNVFKDEIPKISITNKDFSKINKGIISVQYDIKQYDVDIYGLSKIRLQIDGKEINNYISKQVIGGGELEIFQIPSNARVVSVALYAGNMCLSTDDLQLNLQFEEKPNKIHTLLTGVNQYNYHVANSLKSSINDISDFKEALIETYNCDTCMNINLLINKDFTSKKMADYFEECRLKAANDDISLFFFSGHGIYKNEKYYLLPTNIFNNNYENQAISLKFIYEEMNKIPGFKVIFLDACYSGSAISELLKLENIDKKKFAVYASSMGSETSIDGNELTSSSFTTALVNGIRFDLKKVGNSNYISFKDLENYLQKEVAKNSNYQQNPFCWYDSELSDKVLFKYNNFNYEE